MENQPVYLKIVNDVKGKISLGILKGDDPVPSEAAICDTYGVSRLTARKSLEILEREGLVYFVQGKGNFVRARKETVYELSFSEVRFESVTIDNISIIDVDIIESTKELVYLLQIHPETRVLRIRRLLNAGGTPVGFDAKYIPYYPGFPLVEKELEAQDFVRLLSDRTSPYSVKIDLKISSCAADKQLAQRLKMHEGEAVLRTTQLLADDELGIIGYCETLYNSFYAKLYAQWSK